jgi:hypothetical protein
MSLQKIMLLTPRTALADKLKLVFTVTGGWHVTSCHCEQQLDALSRSDFDLMVMSQQCLNVNVKSLGSLPIILLIDNTHCLQDKGTGNIIERFDLSHYPLVSLAERVRVSFHQYTLSEHLSSE